MKQSYLFYSIDSKAYKIFWQRVCFNFIVFILKNFLYFEIIRKETYKFFYYVFVWFDDNNCYLSLSLLLWRDCRKFFSNICECGKVLQTFFANAVNIFLIKGHNDLDKGRLFLFVNYHFKTILRNCGKIMTIFLWKKKLYLRKVSWVPHGIYENNLVRLTPTHLLLQQNAHITESMTSDAKSMLWMITSSEKQWWH